MVYPSHYPTCFNGWTNVNAPSIMEPLIKFVMTSAVERDNALKKKLSPAIASHNFLHYSYANSNRPTSDFEAH